MTQKNPAKLSVFFVRFEIYLLPFFDLLGACVNADPATLLPAVEVFSLLNCFEAVDATLGEVCSEAAFLAMRNEVIDDTVSLTNTN
jgi:hypothetical protein